MTARPPANSSPECLERQSGNIGINRGTGAVNSKKVITANVTIKTRKSFWSNGVGSPLLAI